MKRGVEGCFTFQGVLVALLELDARMRACQRCIGRAFMFNIASKTIRQRGFVHGCVSIYVTIVCMLCMVCGLSNPSADVPEVVGIQS